MKRAEKPSRQIAEQAAQRLRELLSRGDGSPRSERHHAKYLYRQSSDSTAVLSHLHFELDGSVSAEYQTALVSEFELCLSKAREAGPAFSMLGERDRMPTVHWSAGLPARVCVDIYTTGGVKLWAFEHLVQTCLVKAAETCEIPVQAPTVARGAPSR